MTTIALSAVIKEARRRQRQRQRQLTIAVLTLAVFVAVAAFLTAFRVDLSHGLQISFRQQATYQATETFSFTTASGSQNNQTSQALGARSPLYAQIANSAAIRSSVIKNGPLKGDYNAAALSTPSITDAGTCTPYNHRSCELVTCPHPGPREIGFPSAVIVLLSRCHKLGTRQVLVPITWLPFMSINGTAHSPHQAITIAKRASAAFLNYVATEPSRQAPLPPSQMIVFTPVSLPDHATLTQGRNFTLPYTLTGILLALLVIAALTTLKPRQHLKHL